MSTDAVLFIAIPSVMIGMFICSALFSVIVKRSEKTRKALENGNESGYMLLYSYLLTEPDTEKCRTYKKSTAVNKIGSTKYNQRPIPCIYEFNTERKKTVQY